MSTPFGVTGRLGTIVIATSARTHRSRLPFGVTGRLWTIVVATSAMGLAKGTAMEHGQR